VNGLFVRIAIGKTMDNVFAQDLIASVQKRELVKTLRQWREDSTSQVEIDLINDMLTLVLSGDLDG
jgi:hypothetical protein